MNRFIIFILMFKVHLVRTETWEFECNVTGAGSTVWSGSIIHCPNSINGITLLHSVYNSSGGTKHSCDSGDITIVGESVGVVENMYLSRITITSNSNLTGESVECIYDNGLVTKIVMNYTIVAYTTDSSTVVTTTPPLDNVNESALDISAIIIIAVISCIIICTILTGVLIFVGCVVRTKRRKQVVTKRNAIEADHNVIINNDDQPPSNINYAFVQPVILSPDERSLNKCTDNDGVMIVTESNYSYLDFTEENFSPNLQPTDAVRKLKTLSGCVREEDELLNLDSLLIKLRGKVTDRWYQFGIAIGLPLAFLKKLEGYPQEECIIEILDYWLRHHPDQPTWKEIADAMEDIQDYELANSIKGVYELAMPLLDVDDCETRNL